MFMFICLEKIAFLTDIIVFAFVAVVPLVLNGKLPANITLVVIENKLVLRVKPSFQYFLMLNCIFRDKIQNGRACIFLPCLNDDVKYLIVGVFHRPR
jgi:hypothetical protein